MIDYKNSLNPAQYDAVTTLEGPVLVIAGAGSGKTRTIVYRLANLVQSGVPASSILLLTFTRKASQEMLERARNLLATGSTSGLPSLDYFKGKASSENNTAVRGAMPLDLASVQGGTFHSFAFSILRIFQPEGYGNRLTVMDSSDMISAMQHCRNELEAGKGDRSFPRNQTILSYISKSRNKEESLEDILSREAQHLLPHLPVLEKMNKAYADFKRSKNLLDYDDLLFTLEEVLKTQKDALSYCHKRYRYIMVDEYQDTNPVQARIAALLAGGSTFASENTDISQAPGNIMVVGDDAQSIYAFRGADVKNILRFPEVFPKTKIIRLEENYRSTQPILNLANEILENASQGYTKELYTKVEGGEKPNLIRPLSDLKQADLVVSRVVELMRKYDPNDIAILFRSGFHSYNIEIQLNKMGIRFRKYGGIRYAEAAHVKDIMSFIRLVENPLDYTAFARIADFTRGVGPKTSLRVYQQIVTGDKKGLEKTYKRFESLAKDLNFVDLLRQSTKNPSDLTSKAIEHYKDRMPELYPDDHPRRLQALEQLVTIASNYTDLDLFIADLSLDDPFMQEEESQSLVLSTIHSAKGLEWSAVVILDLVEDRFPSRHSMSRVDEFEEERRLMYVACTRAREHLDLFVPASVYDRGSGGSIPATPSPFVLELANTSYIEWQESYAGGLVKRDREAEAERLKNEINLKSDYSQDRRTDYSHEMKNYDKNTYEYHDDGRESVGNNHQPKSPIAKPEDCGYCQHRIFGRGKIVQHLPPDKYRINFPGFGLKVIMAAYLTMDD